MTAKNTGPRKSVGPVSSKPSDFWHRLSDIDPTSKTATCSRCGSGVAVTYRNQSRAAVKRNSSTPYWVCNQPIRDRVALYKRPHSVYKKNHCEWCGFEADIPQLFDVDHKNAQHDDNREENLQTLDARCHRLKTFLERRKIPESEWMTYRKRYGAVPD